MQYNAMYIKFVRVLDNPQHRMFITGLDISTRPQAHVSVKSVARAQIIDYLPVWQVRFLLPRNYLNCKINTVLQFILRRRSLNVNLPFLFYKVFYSELSNKLVLKGRNETNIASSK